MVECKARINGRISYPALAGAAGVSDSDLDDIYGEQEYSSVNADDDLDI